jgi:hypothetical protein
VVDQGLADGLREGVAVAAAAVVPFQADRDLEGKIVATVPSAGYAPLPKSPPWFQGAFIWESSA